MHTLSKEDFHLKVIVFAWPFTVYNPIFFPLVFVLRHNPTTCHFNPHDQRQRKSRMGGENLMTIDSIQPNCALIQCTPWNNHQSRSGRNDHPYDTHRCNVVAVFISIKCLEMILVWTLN